MKKIFSTLVTVMIIGQCFAQKADLKLNLEVGKVYKQTTVSKANIVQEFGGQEMEILMTIKGEMSYLVKSIAGNNYDMDVEYDRLSIMMKMPQGEMDFNSDKQDEDDIFSTILKEMLHKPFHVTMTKKGKVLAVKNIDALFESVFSKFSEIPEAQLAQIKEQLEKSYGESGFRGNIEMVTSIFPDKPVAIGDQWTIETKLESGMTANVTTVYKYVEKNSNYVLIKGDSKVKTVDSDEYMESNGMEMKLDLVGTMVSEVKIDPKTGWIIEAKINQELNGDTVVKPNAQIPDGMTIPMAMKTESLITN